ncbi:MAG: hypothetical protein SGILL_002745 [Bacillariaceae sp.]
MVHSPFKKKRNSIGAKKKSSSAASQEYYASHASSYSESSADLQQQHNNASLAPPSQASCTSSSNHQRDFVASSGGTAMRQRAGSNGASSSGMLLRNKHHSYKRKYGTKVEVTQGVFLEGDDLEDYCRKRGLCPLCATTKVRKKSFKLFKKNKWEPITKLSKDGTVYAVYKGFCVKPDCFTLEQAKRLAGDVKGDGKRPSGILKSTRSAMSGGGGEGSKHKRTIPKHPSSSRGPPATPPRSLHQLSSTHTTPPGIDESGHESDSQRGVSHRRDENAYPSLQVKQQLQRQPAPMPQIVLPLIDKTIQGLQQDSSQRIHILDLSGVEILREVDISTLLAALKTNTALQTLNLENCKLNNDLLVPLSHGLTEARDMPLQKLYLRSNDIRNEGIDALCSFLESSQSLEKLDLSRNHIGTNGAVAVFNALRRNRMVKIKAINMAHNEIWDLEEEQQFGIKGFLAKNRTLKNLNLEGNFLHDEAAEALFGGLQQAGEHSGLQRLYLGWNTIGDDGAIAMGECLCVNDSLQYVDLAENQIQNAGGRALLQGLSNNATLREIAGLWRNKIDRRFIIVAIRRLLLSREGGGAIKKSPARIPSREQAPSHSREALVAHTATDETEPAYSMSTGGFPIPHDDDVSDLSDDPLDHDSLSDDDMRDKARDMSLQPLKLVPSLEPGKSKEGPEVALESVPGVETLMETQQEVSLNFDRISFFQSSPLVFFEKELGIHRNIPLRDYRYERLMIEAAVEEGLQNGAHIEVTDEVATMDRFSAAFAENYSHVMHFSCHGQADGFSLENGYGSLHTLPTDGLRRMIAAVGSSVTFVFVASYHARAIGEAFVEAGIPHVVSCQTDGEFRDQVAIEFMQCFYRQAAKRRSLRDAFEDAVDMVASSSIAENLRQVKKRFQLLPARPDASGYHDMPIFFDKMVPATKEKEFFEGFMHLPTLPTHFTGREIDMYEILESIRVDDIVNISGTPGYGKESVINAVAEYVMQRRKMFAIDDIFWIPAPEGVELEPDSLYDDLCQCCNLIRTSKDDIWDTNDTLLECRERLELELEELKIILIVDDRSFSSKGSQEALEKFISFILNTATAKVILIKSRGDEASMLPTNSSHGQSVEESTIEIGTLDFRSTALLFGSLSRFVSSDGCPIARTPQEFAELLEPPFVARMPDPSIASSQRRTDLYARLGSGLPTAVKAAAMGITKEEFMDIIKIANKPEYHVDSLSELETELRRRHAQKEKAVEDKNYMRAADLDIALEELEGMRLEFPTLKDLKEEEQVMKADLADAVSNRRYDAANDLKRELLNLKKKIMRERRLMPDQTQDPNRKLNQFQAQMESMIEKANDSFKLDDLDRKISFSVNCDDRNCTFSFYYGDIFDFSHPAEAKGIVCWTNEACDLSATVEGTQLLESGGEPFQRYIDGLPIVADTKYGKARCGSGNAVFLGPSNEFKKKLPAPCVVLTVGPFTPGDRQTDALLEGDEDYLQYSEIMLRSCYRSSMVLARHDELQALGTSLLTTHKKGPAYERTIRIGLQTLIEEVKFSHLTDLHLIAKSPKEASLMVAIMMEMGYEFTDDE